MLAAKGITPPQDETGVQLVGQRGADDETAGIDADHRINDGGEIAMDKEVDELTEDLPVLQK